MSRIRLIDIDRAKGLAILLVVIGHFADYHRQPFGNEWYAYLKHLIYMFHMPFFMFLSGTVFFYTYQNINTTKDEITKYLMKKVRRLVPGFLLISILIFLSKYLAWPFLFVDDLEPSNLMGLIDIFVRPEKIVGRSLWYIYVLIELYLLFPIVMIGFRKKLWLVLIFAFVIHFIPYYSVCTDYFELNKLTEYAIFFSIGILFVHYYEKLNTNFKRYDLIYLSMFVISFSSLCWFGDYISKTIISMFSIPAIYGLIERLKGVRYINSMLLLFAGYSLSIYLFNTIFIGLTKGVLMLLLPWDGINFLLYFPLLLLSGIFGPIMLHKLILSRNTYLSSITK